MREADRYTKYICLEAPGTAKLVQAAEVQAQVEAWLARGNNIEQVKAGYQKEVERDANDLKRSGMHKLTPESVRTASREAGVRAYQKAIGEGLTRSLADVKRNQAKKAVLAQWRAEKGTI